MLPLKQNNVTVDIGAARSEPSFRPSTSPAGRPYELADLVRALTGRLQMSLEVDRLLGFFFEEVGRLMTVDGLVYRHAATEVELLLGQSSEARMGFRLSIQGDELGELLICSGEPVSELLATQLAAALDCLIFPLRNALLYRQAVRASLRDPLTGTGNRLALEQSLSRETELARRHAQDLSVVMLDMDHFKTLNDQHGHHAGDAALRAISLLMKEQLRNVDMVFRFGGEEFALVLSNTSATAAAVVAERIRAAIEQLPFLVGERQVKLSASLGCATYLTGEPLDTLLQRADQALYQAKRSGRNQVASAD
ncbi:GGDEF domain-containing protein [Stutzerimonas marianensis]|uniref:diguanylate cyclase n=1 Tax=Stutzerimonas marianensis TaxID=2929513 RepID=A0A9X1W6N8_9GAMM|nr:GGDEF domain-containing protein [Pseudomonas marianensis]MCJ0972338.1 GGDEF domain-containing protein [Pseudomonas marianensis]